MKYPKLTIKKTENENEIDERRLVEIKDMGGFTLKGSRYGIDVRGSSSDNFKGRAFYLCEGYEWVIGIDKNATILVPLKK